MSAVVTTRSAFQLLSFVKRWPKRFFIALEGRATAQRPNSRSTVWTPLVASWDLSAPHPFVFGGLMQTNLILFIFLLPILTCAEVGDVKDTEREQIIKMIPLGDGIDLHEREKLLLLISQVDSIYPTLCEELLKTNNPTIQSQILAVLEKAKESRDEVLPFVREFMRRHKNADHAESIFNGLKTLGALGTRDDIELLKHFLNRGHMTDRVIAARSIDQILDREPDRVLPDHKIPPDYRIDSTVSFISPWLPFFMITLLISLIVFGAYRKRKSNFMRSKYPD